MINRPRRKKEVFIGLIVIVAVFLLVDGYPVSSEKVGNQSVGGVVFQFPDSSRGVSEKIRTTIECRIVEDGDEENIFLRGWLIANSENKGIEQKNVAFYELLFKENVKIKSTLTAENGCFFFSLHAPDSRLSCYRVWYLGDNHYEPSMSPILIVNNINESSIYGLYFLVLSIFVIPVIVLARKISGKNYGKIVILALILGGFILPMSSFISFIISMLIGGVAGYMFAKKTRNRREHLVFGFMLTLIYLLLAGVFLGFTFVDQLGGLGFEFSISQVETLGILMFGIFDLFVRLTLSILVGVIVGGYLYERL